MKFYFAILIFVSIMLTLFIFQEPALDHPNKVMCQDHGGARGIVLLRCGKKPPSLHVTCKDGFLEKKECVN